MARKVRISSLLVAAGLLVQILTETIVHPLSFVLFLVIGCPLMAAGVGYFLLALVSGRSPARAELKMHNPSN